MNGRRKGGAFEAVSVPAHPGDHQYVPGEFITYPELNPIRAAALAAAVEFKRYAVSRSMDPRDVVELAKEFEKYLTGQREAE